MSGRMGGWEHAWMDGWIDIWSVNVHIYRHMYVFYISIYVYIHVLSTCVCVCMYTGCPRRNMPDFGRMFLMLKYTDITQNTYIQS